MILRDAITYYRDKLENASIEDPQLNTEWIFCDVLGVNRAELLLRLADTNFLLSDSTLSNIASYIDRRAKREPLQYILGNTSFCGLEFYTQKGVLVPRPETELLAEAGWNLLNNKKKDEALSVLDYCTGTGCIAISLAMHCPTACFTAIDISPDALDVAKKNIDKHALSERFNLLKGDSVLAGSEYGPFDLVISNPPYIPTGEISKLEPEVSVYEPIIALDGGEDGLKFFHHLACLGAKVLKNDGVLMAEFGDDQFPSIKEIFKQQGWKTIFSRKDYSGRERFFIASYRGHIE